ncbi:hypothetical protein JCM15519_04410 [Fundidesulfovibrio butyratiphilus]
MWATFGDIRFELLRAPEQADLTTAHEYAEHKVIEGKPKVQWVGDGLRKRTWEIRLHSAYCDPDMVMRAIRTAAGEHKALPLSLGAGEYLGRYTVLSIREQTQATDPTGGTVAMTASLELREWIGQVAAPTGEAVAMNGVSPFGAVNALSSLITTGVSSITTIDDSTLRTLLRRP